MVTTLLENPLPIAVAGGLFATLALVVFLSRRNLTSLVALVGVVLATLLLLLVERVVRTDREVVESSLQAAMDAIEANDLPGALEIIDPAAADIRADAETLMPLVKWTTANAASIETTVDDTAQPPTATTRFRAFLNGVHEQSGMAVGYVNQQVDVHWIKRGDKWFVNDYTAYFDGKPIDAMGSAAQNRPVTAP
jgi:hypothetical protein